MNFVKLCGRLAPYASIGLFLAPAPTLATVSKQRTVVDLPLLPYTSMICNAFLWTTYGLLKRDPRIWSANAIGFVLGVIYFVIFLQNSNLTFYQSKSSLPGAPYQHLQAILVLLVISVMLSMRSQVECIGSLAVSMCVIMFGSPLAALQVVWKTQSADSIPLPFTIASLVSCGLWTVTGMFDMKDWNVIIPCALGLVFSGLQLVLKLVFGDFAQRNYIPIPDPPNFPL